MTLTGASKAKLKVTDYRKLIMFSKRVDRGRCTGVVARGTGRFWSWLDDHVLTYVGLSAPLLGAVNPIRAVVSGESMGLPMSPRDARSLELSFGSTNSAVTISSGGGRHWDASCHDYAPKGECEGVRRRGIDGIEMDFESHQESKFETLRKLVEGKVDWDTSFPVLQVTNGTLSPFFKDGFDRESDVLDEFTPRDASSGELFRRISEIYPEPGDPMLSKMSQLTSAFYSDAHSDILSTPWERPPIEHVIMAYGTDVPTEVGYVYPKRSSGGGGGGVDAEYPAGPPQPTEVVWEEEGGALLSEEIEASEEQSVLSKIPVGKKRRKRRIDPEDPRGKFEKSGDGTVPYLSLSWSQTWLLDFARNPNAKVEDVEGGGKRSKAGDALASIVKSVKAEGESSSWKVVSDDDDDTSACGPSSAEADFSPPSSLPDFVSTSESPRPHRHLACRAPLMEKWFTSATLKSPSGKTKRYTTSVIEATKVEHRETPRNSDLLNAVLSEVMMYNNE